MYDNARNQNTLQEYLDCVSETCKENFKKLNEEKLKALKENIVLQHCRLGNVSQTYLDEAAKYIFEGKNVKVDDTIFDCEVGKTTKILREPCKKI